MTREEAIQELKLMEFTVAAPAGSDSGMACQRANAALHMAIEALQEPKRKHALWGRDLDGAPYCSNCTEYTLPGYQSVYRIVTKFSYCPNCGARMDEEEEETS